MNIYDAIVKDYPQKFFLFTSSATTQPDSMGGSSAASSRARTNYALNPSAEAGTGFTSNNTGSWTASFDTATKRSRTRSAKSVPVTAGISTTILSMYNVGGVNIPAAPGDIFVASFYTAQNTAVSCNSTIQWQFLASDGSTVLATATSSSFVVSTGSAFTGRPWIVTTAAPAGTTYIRILATVSRSSGNSVAGDAAWIDDVLIEKATYLDSYFDGSSSGAAWSGTADASSSTWTMPTPVYGGSIVSGPSQSILTGLGQAFSFTFNNRFNKAYDELPFSLECWSKFITNSTIGSLVMSHASSVDGLYFDGDNIRFRVDLDDGSNVAVNWATPDFTKAYHIVGTYSGNKISLYVDGDLKGTANLPDGAVLANKASNILYAGFTEPQFLFEAPAVYERELSAAQVAQHYAAGRQNRLAADAAGAFGGRIFRFSDAERDIYVKNDIDFPTEGRADNAIAGTYLQPVYGSDDLSQAGTYTISVPVADLLGGSPPNVQGMKLEWTGDGNFVVEYSLNNGSSWSTAVNGAVQASTLNMAPTVTPIIRITFAAGRAKGLDVVRSFEITTYKNLTVRATNDVERTMLFNSTTTSSSSWSEPIEMDDASGTSFTASNYAILQESVDTDKTNVGSIEFWIKLSAVGGGYILDSRGVTPSDTSYIWTGATGLLAWPAQFSAVYVNGSAVSNGVFAPSPNRWYHIVGVYATPHNAKISFSPAVSGFTNYINLINTYEAQLTATQVAILYNSYNRLPSLAGTDPNTLTVTETAPAAKAYVNDWSIQGAG